MNICTLRRGYMYHQESQTCCSSMVGYIYIYISLLFSCPQKAALQQYTVLSINSWDCLSANDRVIGIHCVAVVRLLARSLRDRGSSKECTNESGLELDLMSTGSVACTFVYRRSFSSITLYLFNDHQRRTRSHTLHSRDSSRVPIVIHHQNEIILVEVQLVVYNHLHDHRMPPKYALFGISEVMNLKKKTVVLVLNEFVSYSWLSIIVTLYWLLGKWSPGPARPDTQRFRPRIQCREVRGDGLHPWRALLVVRHLQH